MSAQQVVEADRAISCETLIDAPPSRVRQAFLDWPSYSTWTTFIESISGNADEVGSRLTVKLRPVGSNSTMPITPVVVENSQEAFRWQGNLFVKGLFDGKHSFEFHDEGGKCRFVHKEEFGGILFRPLWYLVGQQTKQSFAAFNDAIKKKCEEK